MAAVLTHKRGDRFSNRVTWRDSAGAAIALGAAPRAQIRDGQDSLVQELTVTLEPQSGATVGQFVMSATAAQTALWPAGTLSCDIQRQAPDPEESSETFAIRVLPDVTR